MDETKGKIYSSVSRELFDQITKMAKQFGMTKSAVVGLCTKIGMNYLMTVVEPENVLSTERLVEILIEADKRGVDFGQRLEELKNEL
jgi:hypothetical protein